MDGQVSIRKAAGQAVGIIDVSEINERDVIDLPAVSATQSLQAGRILRHLGLLEQGVRVVPARAPPELTERVFEPWLDDPFPDYETEPVMIYADG